MICQYCGNTGYQSELPMVINDARELVICTTCALRFQDNKQTRGKKVFVQTGPGSISPMYTYHEYADVIVVWDPPKIYIDETGIERHEREEMINAMT